MAMSLTHLQPDYEPNLLYVRGVVINENPLGLAWDGEYLVWTMREYAGVVLRFKFESRWFTTRTNTFSSPYLVNAEGSQAYYLGTPFLAFIPVNWYTGASVRPGIWLALLGIIASPSFHYLARPQSASSPWLPSWPD